MSTRLAKIHIRNLRLRTLIGFNPEEREKHQDVVINAEIHYQAQPSIASDDIDSALNYKTICKAIIQHVEQGQFLLLEKLVNDVLEICSEHPSIDYAEVCIDKPHALRFADSVALSLCYQKS